MKSKRPLLTDEEVLTQNVTDEFVRARSGDTMAIKFALEFIRDNMQRKECLPDYARKYLIEILDAGVQGDSMDKAAGLKRRGARNTWSAFDKRLAMYVLQQFVEQENLDSAIEKTMAEIKEVVESPRPGCWAGYHRRVPTFDQLKKWWNEFNQSDT